EEQQGEEGDGTHGRRARVWWRGAGRRSSGRPWREGRETAGLPDGVPAGYDAARTKRKRAERTPLRPPRKSPKRVPSEADAAVVEAARLGLLELLLRAPLRALAERPGQRRADGALPGLADAELVVDLVLGLELEAGDGERVVGAEAERELVAHQLLLETH